MSEINTPKFGLFKRLKIRSKLITIISLIIISSFSTMIYLASNFFKTDSKVRIQENNLTIAIVTASKVESDFLGIVEKLNLMATTIQQDFKNEIQKNLFTDLFFRNDKNIAYLGIAEPSDDMTSLIFRASIKNKDFMNETQMTDADLTNINSQNSVFFTKSFSGEVAIENVSSSFKSPMLGISFPYEKRPDGKVKSIIIGYIKLEKFLQAFQKMGITETYMINSKGDVIGHNDTNLIMTHANFINVDIVRTLLKSNTDNGQVRYKDDKGIYLLGSYKKTAFNGIAVIASVDENSAFRAVYNIQRRNILIAIIIVNLAVLIVYFFAKTITTPLLRLVGATQEIERGNFRVDIKPASADEIGILTASFINMGAGLEEREKVKNILGNMVDPTVVEEAMKDLAALKRGSEREITAFFSDVASFSTISEQLNSVQLAGLLNEYLSAMTLILKQYDGVLDKYIGDAIVGIFNAPVDVNDHSMKAAHASLDMIRKLGDLREFWTKNNSYVTDAQHMDIRIGLNCGPAKVGFMGTDALANYTMMGDTVNLAARLEAAGKDYGVNILISEMIKNKVTGELFTRELDVVRVKGKNEPVKLYELIGTKSEVSPAVKESTALYEEGFKLYLAQNWDAAIARFNGAEKAKGKKDKSVHQLIERCETYKMDPPGQGWDGVFTRTHK